eukprot:4767643-Pleurochrysis_carterae.AAC.2
MVFQCTQKLTSEPPAVFRFGLAARQRGTTRKVQSFVYSQMKIYDALPAATPETTLACIVKSFCMLIGERRAEMPMIARDTAWPNDFHLSQARFTTSCNHSS